MALHGLPVQPPASHRKSPPPSANRAVVSKSAASPPASALPLVVSLLPLISCVLAILASKRLMPVPVARASTKMAHLPTQLHVHVAVQTRPSFVLRMSTAMQKTKCAPRIRFRLAPTLVASSTIPLAAHVAQLTARTTVLLVCIAARRIADAESTPFVRRVMGLMRIQLPVLVVQTIARMSQNYFVIRHVVCAVRPTCSHQVPSQHHQFATPLMVQPSTSLATNVSVVRVPVAYATKMITATLRKVFAPRKQIQIGLMIARLKPTRTKIHRDVHVV